jgi:hypothetical protein
MLFNKFSKKYFLSEDFLFFSLKGFSSFIKLIFLLIIPLIFINDGQYLLFGIIFPILTSITIISGVGYPVTLVKDYTNKLIDEKEYHSTLLPLHSISILLLSLAVIFTVNGLKIWHLIPILLFNTSEVIIIDYLRLKQADSNLKKHVTLSLYKSLFNFLFILFLYLFSIQIEFIHLICSLSIINFLLIFKINYRGYISIKKIQKKYFKKDKILISLFYFMIYFIDKFLISYDKEYISSHVGDDNFKILIFLTSILLGAFGLLEGSVLLKKYNHVFLNKFKINKKQILLYISLVTLISCFMSLVIYIYVQNVFILDVVFLELLLISFFFLIASTFSWFLNLRAYSTFSSFKFLITTFVATILFFILLSIIVNFEDYIIWSIILLPISFSFINYNFLKWS